MSEEQTSRRAGGAHEGFKVSLLFTWELRDALRSVQRKTEAGLGQVREQLALG